MTIKATEPAKVTVNGNDTATVFSFSPMVIFENADLFVYHVDADGLETLLSEGLGPNDYKVDVPGYPGTGSVIYPADEVTPLPTGEKLVIKTVLDIAQDLDLENQGGYFPDLLEIALDKVVKQNKQQQEEIDRSLRLPISASGASTTLPIPVANSLVGWNASATALVNKLSAGELTVTAYIATLLDDVNAEAARDTLMGDTTKGDLIVGLTGGGSQKLPAGSNDQVLIADNAQTPGLIWNTVSQWFDKVFGTAAGDILIRGASTWAKKTVGATNTVLKADSGQADKARYAYVMPMWGSRGLVAQNNSGTPDEQFDIDSDYVWLWNPNNFDVYMIADPSSVTVDITTSGPAANGRDQSGAFTNDTFIHLYRIWNGSTLASLASASAPPTGPTLPSGYTHWEYIGAVYVDSAGDLLRHYIRGNTVYHSQYLVALSGGSAGSYTSVSLSSYVPANASIILLNTLHTVTTTVGSAYTLDLSVDGTNTVWRQYQSDRAAEATNNYDAVRVDIPNVSQTVYYRQTGGDASLQVAGYTVPNGAV